MFKTEKESILAIHENLNLMGFDITLENLAKMKPTELKKFYKRAIKAFNAYWSVQSVIEKLNLDENVPSSFEETPSDETK